MSSKLCLIILILIRIICSQEISQEILKDSIYDISIDINKKNDELQLSIGWRDNILQPPGQIKSFDVKVVTVNTTTCATVACLAYGVTPKSNATNVILPANPTSVIEHSECEIEPGCWYNIQIATSDRKIEWNHLIEIPDCIHGICSCKHVISFPLIHIEPGPHTNDSVDLMWQLKTMENLTETLANLTLLETLDYLQIEALSMTMHQKTNPTLSWGGSPLFMGQHHLYLDNNTSKLSKNIIYGNYIFHTSNEIIPGQSYILLSHVIDAKNCWSSEKRFEFIIEPKLSELNTPFITKTHFWFVTIPVTIIFLSTIACAILIYKRQHNINKTNRISLHNLKLVDNTIYDRHIEGDIYEIDHKQIMISKEIGSGAFGRVFKGVAHNLYRHPHATVVAIKKLKKQLTVDELDEFLGEIKTLKNAGHHENIVALLGCCTIKEPYMMVMEYVGRGDLLKYLYKVGENVRCKQIIADAPPVARSFNRSGNNNGNYLELKFSPNTVNSSSASDMSNCNPGEVRPSVTETMYTMLGEGLNEQNSSDSEFQYILDHKELHHFAVQICRGMQHLEERGITHRDLAARNILIDDRKTLKISDFGLSRDGIYINTTPRKLPVRWLSIEAMRDRFYSNKSDVWAFGIVLWEIGNLGAIPYPTMEYQEILDFLAMGKRLEKPGICTDELYDLMLQCWNENLSERPSFADILKWLEPLTKTIYVDISSISDDYVFPPTTVSVQTIKK